MSIDYHRAEWDGKINLRADVVKRAIVGDVSPDDGLHALSWLVQFIAERRAMNESMKQGNVENVRRIRELENALSAKESNHD